MLVIIANEFYLMSKAIIQPLREGIIMLAVASPTKFDSYLTIN